MSLFHDREHARVERCLRAGARAFAPAPPSELRARILDAVRAAPPPERAPRREHAAGGTLLAAAAALFVLGSAWWLTHLGGVRTTRGTAVVALSRELFGAGTRVLSLPATAEDNLRLEAARLFADTTRVAEGVMRGLPAPLRAKLESM